MAYDINYNDERFLQVNADKQAALTEAENVYNGMINESDKYYQAQIDASKQWADTQTALQNQQTDFAIEQINQQKEQAHKDYVKEQSGAYVDWQKQSNKYGVNAEQMAASGLENSGFSESSQVAMYTAYQNRVATARDSFSRAVLNYDNAIKDARLQNSSALAEIAFGALQQQLELSLQGFQYKNTLVLEKANKKLEIDNIHYNRYQNVLNQINTENALAEQVRQYNESLAEEKRQYNESLAFQKAQFEEEKRQFNETMAYNKSNSGGGSSNGGDYSLEDDEGGTQAVEKVSNKGKTLNKNSVLDLGIGVISGDELASLVDAGYVSYNESNGSVAWTKKGKAKYGDKPTVSSYQKAKQKEGSGKALDILGLR